MLFNTTRASDIVKDALLNDLSDEVDLIFLYGSSLKGTTHKYSDLDISYTPVHESTGNHITVLVNDVLIDLYPIRWSQLERMANFDDVSCTVLLECQIVYQRTEAVAERFRALPERLRALQQPDARPLMLRKAQEIFMSIGYQYYLLQQQATQHDHQLATMHHAQNILRAVLHCLAVVNQACIDTRKLEQIMALPRLPEGFAETVDRIMKTTDPVALLNACEKLMYSTRKLLLAEQLHVQQSKTTFPAVFDSAYPELKGDLQHLMLACEHQDTFNFNLMSLYHELMIHMAEALTGVAYSDFNSLSEYEQDLVALGFPNLLPYVEKGDYDGLHKRCQAFDQRLQQYFLEQDVELNSFANLDALQVHLERR